MQSLLILDQKLIYQPLSLLLSIAFTSQPQGCYY